MHYILPILLLVAAALAVTSALWVAIALIRTFSRPAPPAGISPDRPTSAHPHHPENHGQA